MNGGIFILDPENYEPQYPGFRQLQKNTPLTLTPGKQEIFTFNTTELAGSQIFFGLGQFSMNQQGQWTLIPYITDRKERDYYLAQIRKQFNLIETGN